MSLSTAVDASAVARVVGIKTAYKNLRRNGVSILPQRVAIFGQGNTASVFSTAKRQITSALEAGQVYGFGSPIHLAALQLLPANGDGVGTIPVTVYPLADGTTPAAGSITPSGSQVTSASYRIDINGIKTQEFAVLAGASITRVCRSIYSAILATLSAPVIPSFTYGTVTSLAGTNTGNGTVTALSASGAPVPGAYIFKCVTAVTNGGVFSLTDPDGNVLTPNVTLTPGAGGTTVVVKAGLTFTVTDGSTDFAVNDQFTITVPATAVVITAKWAGTLGNDIVLSIDGSTTAGTTFTFAQPSGGLVDPTVDAPLALMGNVWETLVVNCLPVSNTTALDTYNTFGEGRWGALTRKPLVVFTGSKESSVTTAIVLPNARTDQRVNSVIPFPGLSTLPFVAIARAVARIAVLANNNPAHDYGAQRLTGLVPGLDSAQWDYITRNLAVTNGMSTTEVNDGVIYLSDVVTFYHPTGDTDPAYRFVVDIVKLQNIIYNLDEIFTAADWNGAPLIPDDQPTTNRSAKKPKAAVAAVCAMIDNLGLEALISDPKSAKATTVAEIDGGNPKRLNVSLTVALSGNSNVKSIDLNFGFFFGTAAIVA